MNTQDTKNTEISGETSDSVESGVEKSSGSETQTAPEEQSQAVPPRASSAIAWLALLLVIVLTAGIAWLVQEGQDREASLAQRVAELENLTRQKDTSQSEQSDRLQREFQSSLDDLESGLSDETSRLTNSLDTLQAQLAGQQSELDRFSASDRDSWLLAEAEYLVRLANQRLLMAGDPVAAQALLSSADAVLREIDDPGLHAARAAAASDIAALRAVPRVDVEGIYLRLAALIEQAENLRIFQLPEQVEQSQPEAAQGWQDRLRQGYEAALAKLSNYIIIRRRDVPMQALMDPQWEGLVRQNLRMLLEQSEVAVLSGNQTLYEASLARAQHWVAQFLDSDEVAARAIAAEIAELEALTIEVPQPDISRSQQALDAFIEQRRQSGGGQ